MEKMCFEEEIVEAQKKGQRVLDCAGCGRTEVKQENHHLLCRHCNKMATEKDRDRLYLLLTGKERVKQNSRKERWGVPTKEIHDAIRDSFTEDAMDLIAKGEDIETAIVQLPIAYPDRYGSANAHLANNPIPFWKRKQWVEYAIQQVEERAVYFKGALEAVRKFLADQGNKFEGTAGKLATAILHSEDRPEYPHSVLMAAAQNVMDETGITEARKEAYFRRAKEDVYAYLESHPGLEVSGPALLATMVIDDQSGEKTNHKVMTKAAALVIDEVGLRLSNANAKDEDAVKRIQSILGGGHPGAGPNANSGLRNTGATERKRGKKRRDRELLEQLAAQRAADKKKADEAEAKKGAKRAHG